MNAVQLLLRDLCRARLENRIEAHDSMRTADGRAVVRKLFESVLRSSHSGRMHINHVLAWTAAMWDVEAEFAEQRPTEPQLVNFAADLALQLLETIPAVVIPELWRELGSVPDSFPAAYVECAVAIAQKPMLAAPGGLQ